MIRKILKDRAVHKALTWRVIATVIIVSATLVVTGSLALAGTIGVLDAIIKTILYWLHEKAWERVDDRNRRRVAGGSEGTGSEPKAPD